MRRQKKLRDSPVRLWKYEKNEDQKKIRNTLLEEQKNICAYTETYFGSTDSAEIEHFNPTYKYGPADGYKNWFLVKAKWNRLKGVKWEKFQPVLHPISKSFENRIIFDEETFTYLSKPGDIKAKNLINLLKLNDLKLAEERMNYIKRRKEEIEEKRELQTLKGQRGFSDQEFFRNLLIHECSRVYFIRAIETVFGIEVYPS